jgi:hypothetical protein
MPKTHCRCRTCGHRRKLQMHPDSYQIPPKCSSCGARSWRRDNYRHAVEIPQMRNGTGRYKVCYNDCHHFPHRMGSIGCKFDDDFCYRDIG